MHNITFKCRIVTPLFMGGADSKTPELRPPSIKGALRFWWRAIHGGMPLADLKQREAEIFGDTHAGRSQFSLQIRNTDTKKKSNTPLVLDRRIYTGINYLFYSAMSVNKLRYYEPECTFELNLCFKNMQDSAQDDVLKALTALMLFGAIGTRARRGAGGIQIIGRKLGQNINTEGFLSALSLKQIQDVTALKTHYEKVKFFLNPTPNRCYSTLGGVRLYLFSPKNTWEDALESIGKPFQAFRADHQHELKASIQRRASPLLFKVLQTDSTHYFPILIHLNGELLPDGYIIMDKTGNHRKATDPRIIADFINTLSPVAEFTL